ncbi:hypothetical protein WJX72_009673 [[Myrmecia] bisecta]|uniref:Leucine-rich repeat domain-containing protein n=1 Tax=[Myrmecia] bisecta TaxID=41462 RepID=A0AAW1NZS8_9CHLO
MCLRDIAANTLLDSALFQQPVLLDALVPHLKVLELEHDDQFTDEQLSSLQGTVILDFDKVSDKTDAAVFASLHWLGVRSQGLETIRINLAIASQATADRVMRYLAALVGSLASSPTPLQYHIYVEDIAANTLLDSALFRQPVFLDMFVPRLKVLELEHHNDFTDEQLSVLPQLTALHRLSMEDLGDDGIPLAVPANMSALTGLIEFAINSPPEDPAFLSNLHQLTNLQLINGLPTTVDHLRDLSNLRLLMLIACDLRDFPDPMCS